MKIKNKNTILKSLPERYRQQYPNNKKFRDGRFSDDIYEKLIAENPLTEEKANEIIGNKSWTSNECDECMKDVFAVVVFNDEGESEGSSYCICLECLNKAINLEGWKE